MEGTRGREGDLEERGERNRGVERRKERERERDGRERGGLGETRKEGRESWCGTLPLLLLQGNR